MSFFVFLCPSTRSLTVSIPLVETGRQVQDLEKPGLHLLGGRAYVPREGF